MTDISKCSGVNCTKKQKCYRYTAKENAYGWQAYGDFDTIKEDAQHKECGYFWPITEED